MTAAAPGIRVEGLVKRYGGRAVVDELDLEVGAGSIVALLGPNGAGKTTTVEIVEGYRRADAGRVTVLGLDPVRDAGRLRPRLGLMLQEGGIYPQARPRELLHLFARFYRRPRDPDALLEAVGLERVADTRWRRLSGGERQRLSLALAIVGRPEALVLDEPTAGMDPAAKAATRDLVASLRADGVTILLTTHELPDVERLADRIVVIDRGRLVAQGSPAELLAGARPRLRMRFDRPLEPAERESLAATLRDGARGAQAEARGAQAEARGAQAEARGAQAEARGAQAEARGPQADAGGALVDAAGAGPADLVPGGDATAFTVAGEVPSPALVGRVARWAEAQGRLLVELRTAGGTLEERYLELVGPDAHPPADDDEAAPERPGGRGARGGGRGPR